MILFIVPRYHPNMTPWLNVLNDAGYDVGMIVSHETGLDGKLYVEPCVLDEDSSAYDQIRTVIGSRKVDLIIHRSNKNTNAFLIKAIKEICKQYKLKSVRYTQRPVAIKRDLFSPFVWLKDLYVKTFIWQEELEITPHRGVERGLLRPKVIPFNLPVAINQYTQSRNYHGGVNGRVIMVGKMDVERKRHMWLLAALDEIGFRGELTLVGASPRVKKKKKKRLSVL